MSTLGTVRISPRFCGPSGMANGGYTCGLLASFAVQTVTVRLLEPVPLDTDLDVIERAPHIDLVRDGRTIAQARPGDLGDLSPPPAPAAAQASAATARYAGHHLPHPAPECFVCGPARRPGDALCLYCGPLDERGPSSPVAAPWTPDPSLADGHGRVAAHFVWAALDCPGFAAIAPDIRPMLLGELTVRIEREIAVGEPCTVVGWALGSSGRKHEAGTAIHDANGALRAAARALWIEPKAPG